MMSIISAAFLQSVAYVPQSALLSRPAVAPRASFCTMQQDELRTFLLTKAQVSEKFIDRVVAICDDEMIGSAHDLEVARDAGLLPDLFKTVIRLGIEKALGGVTTDVSPAAAAVTELLAKDGPTVAVPTDKFEVEPYHAILPNLPLNTYKNKAPLTGSIVSVKRIVGANAPGEVCHVHINSGPTFKYWEGQSLGVIPPGVQVANGKPGEKPGKPHTVRLYSIASTRYGDDLDGNTVSLCVRRAVYWDKELGKEDPAKKGVASNFLCDAKAGTEVAMTGPTGKTMLMPEHTPDVDLIMVATGTGIAPYAAASSSTAASTVTTTPLTPSSSSCPQVPRLLTPSLHRGDPRKGGLYRSSVARLGRAHYRRPPLRRRLAGDCLARAGALPSYLCDLERAADGKQQQARQSTAQLLSPPTLLLI